MNDFTKHELEVLRNDTLIAIKFDDESPVRLLLVNKIQSLIDNYDAQVIPVWHCEKCGHVQ
jgi:hypothetical protein